MGRIGKLRAKKSGNNQQGRSSDLDSVVIPPQESLALSRPVRYNTAGIDYADVDFSDDDEALVININRGIRIAICILCEKDYNAVLRNDNVEAIRRRLVLGKRHAI